MTIAALRMLPSREPALCDRSLATQVGDLALPSPIGLAAGFDKNAEVAGAMLALGFGFVEIGTVTPLPQAGNARPRLFRLVEDAGVINRMGFNNAGQQAAVARLGKPRRGIVGVNIGANKYSTDRIADYVGGVQAMTPVADYLCLNISSPNTPGLRALQEGSELDDLLGAVAAARVAGGPPVWLKIAPDLDDAAIGHVVEQALSNGIDALVVGNTTLSREGLTSLLAFEAGGLSGRPLAELAFKKLRVAVAASAGRLPIVAAGGIEDAAGAYARIRAGAGAVQLYSALVYQGPRLVQRITRELRALLERDGLAGIADAVGLDAGAKPSLGRAS